MPPDTFMAGFPDHPHRGFETVTIMMDGLMRHRDSLGNSGVIGTGGVQWMTAGRGIIHSEMPEAPEGRLDGFQLWVNLPAQLKMTGAGYQDIDAEDIPVVEEEGARIRVITGTYGDIAGPATSRTPMRLLRITLAANREFRIAPATERNVFACVYDGELEAPDALGRTKYATSPALIVFHGKGGHEEGVIYVKSGPDGAALLYAEAAPLNEPVARYGPFVMNSQDELIRAVSDYRNGTFVAN